MEHGNKVLSCASYSFTHRKKGKYLKVHLQTITCGCASIMLRLSLDCTEIISLPAFGVFLWVLCTVHEIRKYGFQ